MRGNGRMITNMEKDLKYFAMDNTIKGDISMEDQKVFIRFMIIRSWDF